MLQWSTLQTVNCGSISIAPNKRCENYGTVTDQTNSDEIDYLAKSHTSERAES